MEEQFKFKIRTFLYYLLVEPFTEKITLPNPSTICWISIFLSLIFKIFWLLWISIILGVFFYIYKEFKSGEYIHWYRERKMKSFNDIKKKLKKEKKEKIENINKNLPTSLVVEKTKDI